MSKEAFMKELEYLLSDIPEEDKKDALDYYRDYLDEAGDMANKAIEEFGSPERIAAIIRSDIRGDLEDGGAFTERGYEDERFRDPNYQVAKRHDLPEAHEEMNRESPGQEEYGKKEDWTGGENRGNWESQGSPYGSWEGRRKTGYSGGEGGSAGKQRGRQTAGNASQPDNRGKERPLGSGEQGKLLKIILFAILVMVALPALLGIGGSIAGILVGAVCVFIAVLVVLAVLTFALLLAGAALCVTGVIAMFSNLLNGLFCFGAGLMVLSLGFLALVLSAWFYGKLVPWLLRCCINGMGRLVHRRERAV